MEIIFFQNITDEFYASLSRFIKERITFLGLKQKDVIPHDSKRVSEIVNCKRTDRYPYLIGRKEYRFLGLLFERTNSYSYARYAINLNGDESFYSEEKIYTGSKNGMKVVRKFVDDRNYDNFLWSHINWKKMYKLIIEEMIQGNVPDELQKLFYENLIDYVPYSNLHYYETTKFGKVWGLYEEQEKKDITDNAIDWCYFYYIETYAKQLKESFFKEFTGKKLDKFDQRFSDFLSRFLKEFLQQLTPKETSFGRQAFKYQEEVDIRRYKLNETKEMLRGGTNEKTALLDEYTTYSRNHIEKLAMFQKQFRELKVENDNQTDKTQDNTKRFYRIK